MKIITSISAIAATLLATTAFADGHCADGKTLDKGKLTIATGNPAYYPWVMDDSPESGQGFEAAVAYAVANAEIEVIIFIFFSLEYKTEANSHNGGCLPIIYLGV